MEREKRSYWIGIVVVTAIFLSSMGTIVAAEKVSKSQLVQECYNKFIAQEKADNDAWCYPDWKSYKFCAYSGCLDDIVMDRWQCGPCYKTDMVYVPGYIDCVDRALDNHLECLKKANEKQRSISKNEGKFEPSFKQWRIDRVTECRKEVHPQIRICKESACRDYCIDQGAPGGKLTGSTCYGACKCDEIPKEINKPPIADAGADITIKEGETVVLSTVGSYDPDGKIVYYKWFCKNKLISTLKETRSLSFDIGQNHITLKVTDNKGASSKDEVVITVIKKAMTTEECNKYCREYHGTSKIHGPEAYGVIVNDICNCYCKEGYIPDETLMCVKVSKDIGRITAFGKPLKQSNYSPPTNLLLIILYIIQANGCK